MMTHHPVDGILLVPVDPKGDYLKKVVAGNTPVVTIDRPIEIAKTDSVGVENRAGARMAVEHLIAHGYRRIVCLAANTHLQTIKERIAGYRESIKNAKLPHEKEFLLTSEETARAALAKLFASPSSPRHCLPPTMPPPYGS